MSSDAARNMTVPQKNEASRALFDDPLRLLPQSMTKLFSFWVRATYPFDSIGTHLSMHHSTRLNRRVTPGIRLGNFVTFKKDAWLNLWETQGPKIIIDDNCCIGARSVISAQNRIHIERDVRLEASVLIQDHNHAYEDVQKPIRDQGLTPGGTIRIERGCYIGQGVAIVCPQGELVLGHHCVVMPNSVVLKGAPPYSLLSGNPARIVEQLDPSQSGIQSACAS